MAWEDTNPFPAPSFTFHFQVTLLYSGCSPFLPALEPANYKVKVLSHNKRLRLVDLGHFSPVNRKVTKTGPDGN